MSYSYQVTVLFTVRHTATNVSEMFTVCPIVTEFTVLFTVRHAATQVTVLFTVHHIASLVTLMFTVRQNLHKISDSYQNILQYIIKFQSHTSGKIKY